MSRTTHRAVVPLSVLLAVQLGLAALLAVRRDPLASVSIDTPLVPAAAVKDADHLVIESRSDESHGKGASSAPPPAGPAEPAAQPARLELVRHADGWVLPGQSGAPADSGRVASLLTRLSTLKRGLPVATSAADLKRFKVADEDFERRIELKGGDKTLDTVYVGDSTGLRKSDARTSADHAVYAVDLPAYDLSTDAGAWLKPDLLSLPAGSLATLDITHGANDDIRLQRHKGDEHHPTEWIDPALTGGEHVQSAQVDALVRQLSQVHVDAVLGTEPRPEWQQDHPQLRVQWTDDKGQQADWTLSRPAAGGNYVLKSSAQPWYCSVSTSEAQALIDASARARLVGAKAMPQS